MVSCSNRHDDNTLIEKKNEGQLVDSIIVIACLDSVFVKVNSKDTSGYLLDFIQRFSEENMLSVSYKLFTHFSEAFHDFLNHPNRILLLPSTHASVIPKGFLLSKPVLERNLPLTQSILTELVTTNHARFFAAKSFVHNVMYGALKGNLSTNLNVLTSFAVNHQDSLQLDRLNGFITRTEHRADIAFLKHYYFKIGLPSSMRRYRNPWLTKGNISPFDDSFKKYSKSYALDWKLVAAISFKESRFNPIAVGAGGAYGLMQFMPFVAKKYQIDGKSTPDQQIRAGCKFLSNAFRSWNSITSEEQRIKFTLASYNAGTGHILDAQRLAVKYGLNPQVWDGNVQLMVNNLSLPKYYKDSLVRSGPYHGHAHQYANLVYQIYLSWKVF